LVEGVDSGACKPVLDALQTLPPAPSDDIQNATDTYAALYRGAAEGCLGDLAAARVDLGSAAQRLPGLNPANSATDLTCQPQMLLIWAYATYLEPISLDCIPA
jgi:hypothetical protein